MHRVLRTDKIARKYRSKPLVIPEDYRLLPIKTVQEIEGCHKYKSAKDKESKGGRQTRQRQSSGAHQVAHVNKKKSRKGDEEEKIDEEKDVKRDANHALSVSN